MMTMRSRAEFYGDEAKNRAGVRAMEAGKLTAPSIVLHYSGGKRAYSVRRLTVSSLINSANLAKRCDFIVKIADSNGRWLHTITADERRALTTPAKQDAAAREIVGRYKTKETEQ